MVVVVVVVIVVVVVVVVVVHICRPTSGVGSSRISSSSSGNCNGTIAHVGVVNLHICAFVSMLHY